RHAHRNAAAMLLGILLDRILERLGGLLVPGQLVIAWLRDFGNLEPEEDALPFPEIGAEDVRILQVGAEDLERCRLGPAEHVRIAEEQRAEDECEEAAHECSAQFAPRRHRDIGEGAQEEGKRDEGDDEGAHLSSPLALRRSLWMRFMLPGTNTPLSSSLKRNTVVSCPSKAS